WGRHWLDVARYADNKGYVFFEEKRFPWAWTYRDYVVRAFNEDLPYDRFVLQQLAADQLVAAERPAGSSAVEGGDRRALAAMGFLTLGARFMNNTHDVLDDRIDVVTRGLLGLTVTCARCHDHKYDPVSQDDYYALYGVFRSSVEPTLPPEFLPSPETDEYRQFQAGMDERLARLSDFIDAQREQIIAGSRKRAGEYLLAVHERRNHPDTENFMLLTDKGGLNPAMIKRWEVYLKRSRRSPDDPIWSVWHAFAALPDDGFAEQAKGTHATLFGDQRPADAAPINSLVREAFAEAPPLSMREVAERYGEALGLVDEQWDRIAAASQPGEPWFDDAAALREVLYSANSPPMIPRELAWGFLDLLPDRPTQDEYKKLLKEVETWSMNQPGAPPRAMTLVDARTPYDPVVFVRGNPNREGEPVERRFLTLLSEPNEPPFSHGSGRLELARKIVDPSNPLTARVMVNRVWMHHFGRGLVTTASDFGLRSETPSHPELLDWLATRFVEEGWSVKQLHRLIMNSAVYQQAGLDVNRAAARGDEGDAGQIRRTVDPENRLLSFFPQRRLSFEMLRDSLLSVAGSLDDRVGGPPTNVLGGFNSRRTIYGFIDRMDLPGLMRAFDFPDPASSSPGRERTTIAPQALFFMNDPFVAEAARRFGSQCIVRSIATDEQRVEHVYRLLFARSPDADELSAAKAYLASSSDGESGDSAWKYGYGRVDEDTQRVAGFTELTHWTGTRWQASGQLPDPKLGWVFLDRQGGHPAATIERCAIRRWTAPVDGEVEIAGQLHHRPEPGNGVRARLVSSRHGVLGTWSAHHTSVDTGPVRTRVAAGDTIDFVVDFNGEILHDEHEWPVVIRHVAESPPNDAVAMWDSVQDFRGGRVDRWQAFLHALLMTNEFVFVD
ncbi:MAG: DUF1553 domain-containing protein, partial [Planctomycetales bacterium]|nr:DUF1553 domain-containing protein [Planctomycetales bacterium]